MPGSPHLHSAAPSAGRLRSQRAAAGVVAGYIHELAHTQPAVGHDRRREIDTETASSQRIATAGTRLRAAARRRTRGPVASRSLIAPVACPAA